ALVTFALFFAVSALAPFDLAAGPSGCATATCSPIPAIAANSSGVRTPLTLVNVQFSPALPKPRYPKMFSIDKIDEALTRKGATIGCDRGKNGAGQRSLRPFIAAPDPISR